MLLVGNTRGEGQRSAVSRICQAPCCDTIAELRPATAPLGIEKRRMARNTHEVPGATGPILSYRANVAADATMMTTQRQG